MAVPFALPDEDDGNAAVEQIFAQIHALLRLLQQQIQSRQTRDEVVVASSRVRSSSSSRRSRDDQQQQQQEDQTVPTVLTSDSNHLTELVTLPALLSTLRGAGEVDAVSISRRGQRRRTNSESSCCEDGKPGVMNSSVDVGVTTVHWTQQEEEEQTRELRKGSSCGSEGLLSKLVTSPPISGSIWTAVICVVGWHLLRTR